MNVAGVLQHRFTDEEWTRILAQVGFGNPHAPLWFLGMEEALPGNPKVDPEIPERVLRGWLDRRRLPFGAFEDFEFPPVYNPDTPTWKIMAKLARLLLHKANDDWKDPYATYQYIGSSLGRGDGETLLIELLPLPASSTVDWPPIYNERFPGGREEYHAQLLPKRIERLRILVDEYHPRIVICYGRANWPHYRDVFGLHAVQEEAVAGDAKVLFGHYHRTVVALTPFFDYRYFPHAAIEAVGVRIAALARE